MNLPKIIFGTSGLGNLYTTMPEQVKCAIVKEYIDSDWSDNKPFFDSAGKYGAGLALEAIGTCLRQLDVAKDDVIISNKLGWLRAPLTSPEPTFEPGVWKGLCYDAVQKISYKGILECYEQGNQLLAGYDVSYVSVHDPDEYLAAARDAADKELRYRDILDAYAALTDLKHQGKVQRIGVGAKDWKCIVRISQDVRLDWVMIANSMTVHSHPQELLTFMQKLKDQGIVIINSALFNGGFLAGGEHFNYKLVDPESRAGKELLDWRSRFFSICNDFDLSPATVCISFGSSAPGVQSIALGATDPSTISLNASLISKAIPEKLWIKLFETGLISSAGFETIMNRN